MGAKRLSFEDADALRSEIEAKYGSINKFSKATGITSPDLYSVLNSNKPLYPKWESAINTALNDGGRIDDIAKTLCALCQKVEQISVELNSVYYKYRQAHDAGIMEREVTNE